jgi:hypothetical protein
MNGRCRKIGIVTMAVTAVVCTRPFAIADSCAPRGGGSQLRDPNPRVAPGVTTTDDSRWDDRFVQPGIGHNRYEYLNTMIGTSRGLYIGGSIGTVLDIRVNGIAHFDGSRWSSLGGGIDFFSEDVDAIHHIVAVDSDVYASGAFASIGGVAVSQIARWDGEAWHAVSSEGLPEEYPGILELFEAGGRLHTVWYDDQSGVYSIYAWNDDHWSWVAGHIEGWIRAMAVVGDDLYVAGYIVTAGGDHAGHIVRWDGEAWHRLGDGLDGAVHSLVAIGDDIYVAGEFTQAGTTQARGFARWNGQTWTGLDVAPYEFITSLVVSDGEIYTAAYELVPDVGWRQVVAHWSANEWVPVSGAPIDWRLRLAAAGADLYVLKGWNIFRRHQGEWVNTTTGNGTNGVVRTLEGIDDRMYAGGLFADAGPQVVGCVASWETSGWSSFGQGLCPYYTEGDGVETASVTGIARIVDDVFASDDFGGVHRWDGETWMPIREQGAGTPWYRVEALAIATFDDRLYLGGIFFAEDGVNRHHLLVWDGEVWQPVVPGPNGAVLVLEVVDGELVVAGDFTGVGPLAASRVAKFDGTNWTPLGKGMDGPVFAITTDGDNLYAGGDFSSAGCGSASSVARWDGIDWWPVGLGVNGTVRALATIGTDLYAGGSFSEAGGAGARSVARWNGEQWASLGSGTDGPVYALASIDSDLFVGGGFRTAGGRSARGISIWHAGSATTTTTLGSTTLAPTTTTSIETTTTSVSSTSTTTTFPGPVACGRPVSGADTPAGSRPRATDCLFILNVAVGAKSCVPTCVCDVNALSSPGTTATDALVCLAAAVGQSVELGCLCPVPLGRGGFGRRFGHPLPSR